MPLYKMSRIKESGKIKIAQIITLLLCMVVAFIVCLQKQGFHEDEFYSFYSSNRTDGFWVMDGETVDRQTILNEYSVIPGEGYNFGLVREVQSWDVHPPLYYFVLHFVSSLTPGKFGMWQGLIINLIAYAVAVCLMWQLVRILIPGDVLISMLVTFAWGVSAATLTGVVFIRMYMLLTVWILLVTLLHIKNLVYRSSWFYPALGVLTFLGFMTHYYFFIWLFFLAVGTNLYELIKRKTLKGIMLYALTMVITFGLCYLFYPAWPAQMFRGQRGAQATGNFFDLSNTLERIKFFGGEVNKIGFGGILWAILIVAALLVIDNRIRKQASCLTQPPDRKGIIAILGFACFAYFCVVAKTALLLGASSIRYEQPMLGVLYAVVAGLIYGLVYNRTERLIKAVAIGMLLVLTAGNILGVLNGQVSFLYPEEKENQSLLEEYQDAKLVYAYDSDPSAMWCIWAVTDELLAFPEVYFTDGRRGRDTSDSDSLALEKSQEIILYVDKAVDYEDIFHRIQGVNPQISTITPLFTHEYCDVYLCR